MSAYDPKRTCKNGPMRKSFKRIVAGATAGWAGILVGGFASTWLLDGHVSRIDWSFTIYLYCLMLLAAAIAEFVAARFKR